MCTDELPPACTCCGIRDAPQEVVAGIRRMREVCDQRICDVCTHSLSVASVRALIWLRSLDE